MDDGFEFGGDEVASGDGGGGVADGFGEEFDTGAEDGGGVADGAALDAGAGQGDGFNFGVGVDVEWAIGFVVAGGEVFDGAGFGMGLDLVDGVFVSEAADTLHFFAILVAVFEQFAGEDILGVDSFLVGFVAGGLDEDGHAVAEAVA